jgi:hypothetical protein
MADRKPIYVDVDGLDRPTSLAEFKLLLMMLKR